MSTPPFHLSVVIPLYNEQDSLPELLQQLEQALHNPALQALFPAPLAYEIIMVDDGSTDGSAATIRQLATNHRNVRLIAFQRNFGKTAALSAGFIAASGELVCTLDADLQDDPSALVALVAKLNEGYDLVSGWKQQRNDPLSKTIPSKFFNAVTRLFTGLTIHDANCGLKVYRRDVVKRLELHGDMHRYIPVLASWLGFKIAELPVPHHPRKYGTTKYGMSRFIAGLLDFLSVLFITRYLRRPLHFFGTAGLLSTLCGFSISLYVTLDKVLLNKPVSNRPILFLGILLMILGVQLFSTGLLGELLSTNNNRQSNVIIRETMNITDEQAQALKQ